MLEEDARRRQLETQGASPGIIPFDMSEKVIPKAKYSNYLALANFATSILGILFLSVLILRRLISTICLKQLCCNCCVMSKKTSVMEQAKLAKKVDKADNDLVDDIIEILRYKRKMSVAKGKATEPVELVEE